LRRNHWQAGCRRQVWRHFFLPPVDFRAIHWNQSKEQTWNRWILTVPPAAADALALLRRRIASIEAGRSDPTAALHAPQNRILLGLVEADAMIGGLAPAVVHEIFAVHVADAAAATGFALALVSRFVLSKKPWLWIRQDFAALEMGELYGPGLAAFGLDPSRLIIVTAPETAGVLHAAEEALRCRSVGAVLIEPWGETRTLDLTASRRLHLAAAENRTTAILLRSGGRPAPSAATTRWLVGAAPSHWKIETEKDSRILGWPRFDAALIRNRQGRTGRWLMEWNNDDRIFRAPATFLVRIHTVAPDRPASPTLEKPALRRAG
jgi:protein ImuA